MTQDTNNQEWWEEDLLEVLRHNLNGVQASDASNPNQLTPDVLKMLIRKVSQQSREDALKECVELAKEEAEGHTHCDCCAAYGIVVRLSDKLPKQ